jgi:phosphate transport system protein
MERPLDIDLPPGDEEIGAPHVGPRGVLERGEREAKDAVLRMGSRVELQISAAVAALLNRDQQHAAEVVAGDREINDMQRAITELVAVTIATQAPVARDLRFLLALNHVASELERIGDHAAGIARQVKWFTASSPIPSAADIRRMGEVASELITGVLQALVDGDPAAARATAQRDDLIDHGYKRVFTSAVQEMQSHPEAVDRGTRTVLVAHWLERIGDRATNIAEDVVQLATGQIEELNP